MRQLLFILFFTTSFWLKAQQTLNPKWSFIADSGSSICSPMVVNGIAIIGSGWEDHATSSAVMGIDIADGSLKWKKKFENQIIAISAPNHKRVIAAGRKAIFTCLEYETGNEMWSFNRNSFGHVADSLRFNFYHPQWVKDLNNDGKHDLITIYGGGSTAKKPHRPAGYLLAIDGENGTIIGADTMPDGLETFSTPIVYDSSIYFGTGGETFGGSFYEVKITDLLANNISNAKEIVKNSNKGFIPAASIFGNRLIIPCLDETIYVYNLTFNTLEFEININDHEIYSSVNPLKWGLFFSAQKGKWPFYSGYSMHAYSTSGTFIDSIQINPYHFVSPISINTSKNAVFYPENTDLGFSAVEYHHRFAIANPNQLKNKLYLTNWIKGIHLFSTPRSAFLVEDNFGNLSVDCYAKGIVTVSGYDLTNYYQPKQFIVQYYELPNELDLTWHSTNNFGGYMGNHGDGLFYYTCLSSAIAESENTNVIVFPNPSREKVFVLADKNLKNIELLNSDCKTVIEQQFSAIDIREFKPGVYFIVATFEDGNTTIKKLIITP